MFLPVDTIIAIIVAYLFGSISSAIVTCKLMGLPDPRTQGSGNPGATNVLRLGGKKAAIITLCGDVIKGVIPVLAAKWIGLDMQSQGWVTLAAFLGHLYPVFFRFQGGKGVATAFGCLVAWTWPVGLALLATWLITAMLFRYSSLAALVTALLAPAYASYFIGWPNTLIVCILSALLIFRHRSNIRNLLAGEEKKLGKR